MLTIVHQQDDTAPSPAPAFPDPDPEIASLAASLSRWFTPSQVRDLTETWKRYWAVPR